jgi:hypothetical protein
MTSVAISETITMIAEAEKRFNPHSAGTISSVADHMHTPRVV